jgi:acylglycerol lipase
MKKRFLYGFSMGGTVVIQLHRKDPTYWDGAVLLAPMCKVLTLT